MAILNTETLQARLSEIKAPHPAPPWAEQVAVTEHAIGTVIYQAPGHPNDRHYHLKDDRRSGSYHEDAKRTKPARRNSQGWTG